jgi:N-acetylneuraminic acid mutarotase
MGKSAAAMLVLVFLIASCIMVAKPAFSSADTAEDTWTTKAPMHEARSNLGVAVVDGKIYAIGGVLESGAVTGTNEEYYPETDTWTFKGSMPTPRSDFSVEVYKNKIYCIGGASGDVNEVYDPATDTWETKAPLPTPRTSFATVVLNDRIYVIGGKRGAGAHTGITEVYDPASNKWEKKVSMPNPSVLETCIVINGKIYVIRGASVYPESVGVIAVYDEDTDSWVNKARMPVVKHGAAVVFDDKIYHIGGSYEDSPSWGLVFVTLLQIYDPSTDTWSEGARPPHGGVRHWSAFMTMGDMAPKRIYVVDEFLRIYDPEKDVWTLGSSKTVRGIDMGVTVLNDKIYAIGGFTVVSLGLYSIPQFTTTRYATNEVYTPVGYGKVPPFIDVVSPGSQPYNESSVLLVFTVDKLVNWMGYSLDGQDNVTVTGNTTLDGVPNGLHNVTVYAKDTLGNVGVSETVSFNVKVPFPIALVVAPVASVIVVGTALLFYFKKRKR